MAPLSGAGLNFFFIGVALVNVSKMTQLRPAICLVLKNISNFFTAFKRFRLVNDPDFVLDFTLLDSVKR